MTTRRLKGLITESVCDVQAAVSTVPNQPGSSSLRFATYPGYSACRRSATWHIPFWKKWYHQHTGQMSEVTFVFKVYISKNENKNMIECKGVFFSHHQIPASSMSTVHIHLWRIGWRQWNPEFRSPNINDILWNPLSQHFSNTCRDNALTENAVRLITILQKVHGRGSRRKCLNVQVLIATLNLLLRHRQTLRHMCNVFFTVIMFN